MRVQAFSYRFAEEVLHGKQLDYAIPTVCVVLLALSLWAELGF